MTKPQSPNLLLARLPAADFELLRPHLKPTELVHESVLFAEGDRIDRVFFPHSGIISLVVGLAGGEMIEAGMIGRDSALGASSALDGQISLNRSIVQLPGYGSTIDATHFRKVVGQSAPFRVALMRHEQALFAEAQQSAACNASHKIENRLARWLLRSRDLSGGDTLELTQEFLAQMLGVQRSSVSIVASTLQHAGLIRYSRGTIEITNLAGLREASCECYEKVKSHYDRLLKHN